MTISTTLQGALLCIIAVAGQCEEQSYAYVPASPGAGLIGTLAVPQFPCESEIVLVGGHRASVPTVRPRARVFTLGLAEFGERRPDRRFAEPDSTPDGARWPDSRGRIWLSGTGPSGSARTEGPNPFLLRGKHRRTSVDYVLTCGGVIIGNGTTPVAFVNGRVVRGGDTLGDLRVYRVIHSGAVVQGRGAFAVLPIGITAHVELAED